MRFFLQRLVAWLIYISMHVSLGCYIKLYVENNGRKATIDEVWNLFRNYFFRVLLMSLPVVIAISLGTALFVAPGVYLLVAFFPFSMIAMAENTNLPDTFNRCFELIKNNFWVSLLLYAVTIIIYVLSSGLASFVISAVTPVINYLTTYDLSKSIILITSFFNVFSFCFYMIVVVSVAFNYYSMAEKRDGTGILGRIDEIGEPGKKVGYEDEIF